MKNAMRLGLAITLFFLGAATAAAMDVTGIDIKEYGVYAYDDKTVSVEAPKNGAAADTKLTNIRLVERTYRVPLAPMTFFNLEFVVNGKPQGQEIDIELRIKTPRGETSKGIMKVITGQPASTSIEFAEPDQTGVYVLSIRHKERELFAKELNVYRP